MNHKKEKAEYDKKRRQKETEEERELSNEGRRKLYATNPSIRKENNKKWKKRNPDKIVLQAEKRRAMIKNVEGSFSDEDWKFIKKMFDYKCAYCEELKKLTMDHVMPLSKGGFHDKYNIVPACINCNSQKHDSVSGWPINTCKQKIVEFYKETLDNCKRVAFAESVG